jgi:hypothetical protein
VLDFGVRNSDRDQQWDRDIPTSIMVARYTCTCELASGMVVIEYCVVCTTVTVRGRGGGRLQVTFTHAQTQTRLCCRFDKRKRVTVQLLLGNMPMTGQTRRYRRGAAS